MLFKYLTNLKNDTNDKEFKEILKMVSDDIKFNRIRFGKVTSAPEFINLCELSKGALSRC